MKGTLNTLARRLLVLIPTGIVATLIVFGLEQLTPGGAAEAAAGQNATPQLIATLKHQMGLDKPVPLQYWDWISNAARFNFGNSLISHQNVAAEIGQRLPVSVELTVGALIVALAIGIPLGVLSAARAQSKTDDTLLGISGISLAIPPFVLSMIGVYVFALKLAWLPPTGWTPLSQDVGANLQTLVLPAITLGLGSGAIILRQTRASMTEALSSPYVRTAFALGLPKSQIYFRFALKNALIPVVTQVGLIFTALLGVAVVVEQIFVIPGMGSMLVGGVTQKDFPITQGVTFCFIVIVILVNLIVDLSYAVLDPRIRT